jgi:hypothetical protein
LRHARLLRTARSTRQDWLERLTDFYGELKVARRYHWLSEGLESFVDEPHAAKEARVEARSST